MCLELNYFKDYACNNASAGAENKNAFTTITVL